MYLTRQSQIYLKIGELQGKPNKSTIKEMTTDDRNLLVIIYT